ncbi:DUF3391 domain-containing protein, partial [Escherichia coli]|uniref:DUF3391 domain-containing protein n=1 Tax=Escherichia coli TaxID=562 RepID=UPI0028E08C04
FMIKDSKTIQKMTSSAIRTVLIDTSKGLDTEIAPPDTEACRTPATPDTKQAARVSVAEESIRAKALYREATKVISNMMT